MSATGFDIRTQAPFIRLLIPFATGILTGYYLRLSPWVGWIILSTCILLIAAFRLLQPFARFRFYWITGILINLLLFSCALLFIHYKNIRNHANWIGNYPQVESVYIGKIDEPLSEKPNSLKTIITITHLVREKILHPVTGKVIVYFHKDTSLKKLLHGSTLAFNRKIEPVTGSGSPGSFDYATYASLQGIYHQVYLPDGSYLTDTSDRRITPMRLLQRWKEDILHILQKNIPGREVGLAEALLVGYKDHLEKSLVSSYSNTGVVHVIAISGLHLGLIYWLLSLMLKPLGRKGVMKTWRPLIIITGLWMFSIIAGASPSVLRSAVMFSFIVAGDFGSRKTSILNSLAASAFLLLCYNPFWLWDAGFQLSYIAVLSLVLFMRPIYNSIYVKNKLLDLCWQLSAVTIAAQVLTTPISIYLFHQFPVYFLITNLLCIPLSSLILITEIGLCVISFLKQPAAAGGLAIQWMIKLMNDFIGYMDKLPGGRVQMLNIDFSQVILLYVFIACISVAILQQSRKCLLASLVLLLAFFVIRFESFYSASRQLKLVVFNTKGKVIDVMTGRKEMLLRDTKSLGDSNLEAFQLKPCRISAHIKSSTTINPDICGNIRIRLRKTNFLILNQLPATGDDSKTDVLILGKEVNASITAIQKASRAKLIVFDGSASAKKLQRWKNECEASGIPYWCVAEKGAFVFSAN